MFAALQNTPVWWGARVQTADQTCPDQPFLPEVRGPNIFSLFHSIQMKKFCLFSWTSGRTLLIGCWRFVRSAVLLITSPKVQAKAVWKALTGANVSALIFACVLQGAPSNVGCRGVQRPGSSWGPDLLTAQWPAPCWSHHLGNRWSLCTSPNYTCHKCFPSQWSSDNTCCSLNCFVCRKPKRDHKWGQWGPCLLLHHGVLQSCQLCLNLQLNNNGCVYCHLQYSYLL